MIAEEATAQVGVLGACQAAAVSRATFYRRRQLMKQPVRVPEEVPEEMPESSNDPQCGVGQEQSSKRVPWALSEEQQRQVLDLLQSERFVDRAPRQVWATLLDEKAYHCSVSTMYRLLRGEAQVRERRRQRRHPQYAAPELLATAPNQVWSWDITKLKGPEKWSYYCLYVVMDIFSRLVVGWMVAEKECQILARELIDQTCRRQNIAPGQLVIHADRGAVMRSHSLAELLDSLGVEKSHSRPHVSNDNPFSEAHFKTMKYAPAFPPRFGSLQDARAFARGFFRYYNDEHRHSGLALLTPRVVHYGLASQITAARQSTLDQAHLAYPDRFRRPPKAPALPEEVWINPPIARADPADPQ